MNSTSYHRRSCRVSGVCRKAETPGREGGDCPPGKRPYISFANCGLPYYISGTVASRKTGNTVVSSGENHKGYYAVIQLRMIFIFTFRLPSFII